MDTKIDNKINKLILSFKERTQSNLARVKFLVAFITTVCLIRNPCIQP